jgi:hypothetical protein
MEIPAQMEAIVLQTLYPEDSFHRRSVVFFHNGIKRGFRA